MTTTTDATTFVDDRDITVTVSDTVGAKWPVIVRAGGDPCINRIFMSYAAAIDLSRQLRIAAGIDEAPSAPNEAA